MILPQKMPRLCHLQTSLSSCLTWRLHQNNARIGECVKRRFPTPRGISMMAAPRQHHPYIPHSNTSISTNFRSLNSRIQLRNYDNLNTTTNPLSTVTIKRSMSDEIRGGTDLLEDSLAHGARRKIILESYAPSGVDVKGLIQVGDAPEEGALVGEDKIVHMNGSIVAFPHACFLWNVETPEDVTLASLSVVKLYEPAMEYLFIGCDKPLLPPELNKIKKEFRKKGIVVEQMDIMNAMGTFNILNGEDRRVACVLVIDPEEES
mmetsp:Transcript_792/g.1337  ORF Transcript_792/g.1337 Transcript_792/m.1337 type:complete len:262 (-) Transcript_792:305-1090(-)